MPYGIYPTPQSYFTGESPPQPSRRLRLKTWWRRDRLDQQLARGVDRTGRPELELRSSQLVRPVARTELASALESVVQYARYGPVLERIEVLRGAEVSRCADELLALAHRLRDDQPIDVRGVAMTSRLLKDPRSSLYHGAELPLRHAIRAARFALDQHDDGHATFPVAA
jgi:hypothetical protein